MVGGVPRLKRVNFKIQTLLSVKWHFCARACIDTCPVS